MAHQALQQMRHRWWNSRQPGCHQHLVPGGPAQAEGLDQAQQALRRDGPAAGEPFGQGWLGDADALRQPHLGQVAAATMSFDEVGKRLHPDMLPAGSLPATPRPHYRHYADRPMVAGSQSQRAPVGQRGNRRLAGLP